MVYPRSREVFKMRSASSFRSRFGCVQLALLAAVALLMVSCSSDDTSGSGGGGSTGPSHSADQLNTMGWESFDIADYTQARVYFEEATTLNPNHNAARLGLAWTEAYTGDHQNAIANFQIVIDNGSYTLDGTAGKATASLAVDADEAVSAAQSALDLDADYSFYKRPSFNALDLHLIIAEAHFTASRYPQAQDEVDILDPDNGLDPGDSDSWVVDGVLYPTYQQALLFEIEMLASELAGPEELP